MVVCVFCVNLILGRAFQLHEYQREAVDKQDDIGAAVVAILDVCKLIDHIKAIIGYGLVVDQIHNRCAFFALYKKSNGDTVLQVIHELHVLLQQTTCIEITKLVYCFVDRIQRQSLVELHETVHEDRVQQRAGIITLHVRGVNMSISHVFEQLYNCLLEHILCEMHSDAS